MSLTWIWFHFDEYKDDKTYRKDIEHEKEIVKYGISFC